MSKNPGSNSGPARNSRQDRDEYAAEFVSIGDIVPSAFYCDTDQSRCFLIEAFCLALSHKAWELQLEGRRKIAFDPSLDLQASSAARVIRVYMSDAMLGLNAIRLHAVGLPDLCRRDWEHGLEGL